MNNSKIEWTEKTWNPVTGCSRVSIGCRNCYAGRIAETRLKHLSYYKNGFYDNVICHPNRLYEPKLIKEPSMIFVNSMSDLFHPSVPFEFIDQVFMIMSTEANQHIYQVLTKRSERLLEYCHYVSDIIHSCGYEKINGWAFEIPENIWIGVSIEDHHNFYRINYLRSIPAKIKFISFEPLLCDIGYVNLSGIDWVIVGSETGPKYREMNPQWALNIYEECKNQNVPFFIKQMSGRNPIPDNLMIREYPDQRIYLMR